MNCDLQIRTDFVGPTVLELEPVLDDIQGPVEVRWEGTSPEVAALSRHPKRFFVLIVPDLSGMERAATVTGKSMKLDGSFVDLIKNALNTRHNTRNNWRTTVDDLGSGVVRGIITKMSADSIRRGNRPYLASITTDLICDGISSQDTDVLLRLRAMRS